MKLSSIRWRLVLSYVLLTLVTAGSIGVFTLSLTRSYLRRQETEHLKSNAEAIARQALPLMQPAPHQSELEELAQSASFFTNARVRILDAQRRPLADSGPDSSAVQVFWIAPAAQLEFKPAAASPGPFVVELPAEGTWVVPGWQAEQFIQVVEELPPDMGVTIVRRVEGPWGDRIMFRTASEAERVRVRVRTQVPDELAEEGLPRSEQVVAVPVGAPQRLVGQVELSSSPDFSVETLATTARALLVAAGGASLLAVVLGLLVSRELTAPLRGLAEAASRMSGGDLSARAPVRGQGEIARLARQFNQMADRLEANFDELAAERDALRRFIGDASHELRTPITALKTFNELLQGPAGDEAGARAEFLAESQVQLERLERITHNLLDLSRLDAGLVHLELADRPVPELIQTAVSALRNRAHEKGIALRVEEPLPRLALRCDRVRIESALYNLVDNAIKFTPPGGQVAVGAKREGDTLRLWVRDSGPGIHPEDRPHIFERFYRGQPGEAEGSGLGLAIVHSVVHAHAGRVRLESEPGQGSLFSIELPV
jgi:two-component system sensor histidine kinase BaeS